MGKNPGARLFASLVPTKTAAPAVRFLPHLCCCRAFSFVLLYLFLSFHQTNKKQLGQGTTLLGSWNVDACSDCKPPKFNKSGTTLPVTPLVLYLLHRECTLPQPAFRH